MTDEGFVKFCVVMCQRGFENEHAWQAWLKVRLVKINRLPQPLKAQVMAAWTNSGPKELR